MPDRDHAPYTERGGLLIILAIVLSLFGGKKLPEIASESGKAVCQFKGATSEPAPVSGAGYHLPEQSATAEMSHTGADTRG